jgi:hypothetical protein
VTHSFHRSQMILPSSVSAYQRPGAHGCCRGNRACPSASRDEGQCGDARSKFEGLPASLKDPIRIPLLEERTAADVDMQSVSFSAYYANLETGMVKRSYVNSWLKPIFAEFDRKQLNAL